MENNTQIIAEASNDFYKILLDKLATEPNELIRNRISYQLNNQFNVMKINASFMGADLDKQMLAETKISDVKFRYLAELEEEMVAFLNSRPRNDVVAGLILENILQTDDNPEAPLKYYTLDAIKLLVQYFHDHGLVNETAKNISNKLNDENNLLKYKISKDGEGTKNIG